MNDLLCNHEINYIRKRGEQYDAEIGDLAKSFVSGKELRYAGKDLSFTIKSPDRIKESKILPNMEFYHWNLKMA